MRDLSVIQGAGQVSAGGDWTVLSDLDVRRQSLLRRLTTPLGALWYDPAYGNEAYRLLSQPATEAWRQQIEMSCRRAAEQESGLQVTEVTLQQDGRRIQIRLIVIWDGARSDSIQATLRG